MSKTKVNMAKCSLFNTLTALDETVSSIDPIGSAPLVSSEWAFPV